MGKGKARSILSYTASAANVSDAFCLCSGSLQPRVCSFCPAQLPSQRDACPSALSRLTLFTHIYSVSLETSYKREVLSTPRFESRMENLHSSREQRGLRKASVENFWGFPLTSLFYTSWTSPPAFPGSALAHSRWLAKYLLNNQEKCFLNYINFLVVFYTSKGRTLCANHIIIIYNPRENILKLPSWHETLFYVCLIMCVCVCP